MEKGTACRFCSGFATSIERPFTIAYDYVNETVIVCEDGSDD